MLIIFLLHFLLLLQCTILSPTFLLLTGFPLPLQSSLNCRAAFISLLHNVNLFCQDLTCDLPVLGLGACRLTFNHNASWLMDQLDCGIGFVLDIQNHQRKRGNGICIYGSREIPDTIPKRNKTSTKEKTPIRNPIQFSAHLDPILSGRTQ
jgi:hypothetical protein